MEEIRAKKEIFVAVSLFVRGVVQLSNSAGAFHVSISITVLDRTTRASKQSDNVSGADRQQFVKPHDRSGLVNALTPRSNAGNSACFTKSYES
jgi:hypothetical protein